MEDYDYIGDHGYTQGADFDLDEFNGRWCVTPEFPAGTYAYFVAIDPSGIPVFPYNIGRGYYGEPTGSNVTNITEAVTTHFLGEIDAPLILDTPTVGAGSVTLTWSAAEGGHYRVESSTNSSTWTVLTTDARANQITGSYTNIMSNPAEFYRVARWTFDWFDPVLDIVAPGGSASRGTTVIVTVTLPPAPPPPPPAEVPAIVTLGGMVFGMGLSRPDPTRVAAIFEIPPTMPAGAKDIYVEFFGGPIYTLTGALTIK